MIFSITCANFGGDRTMSCPDIYVPVNLLRPKTERGEKRFANFLSFAILQQSNVEKNKSRFLNYSRQVKSIKCYSFLCQALDYEKYSILSGYRAKKRNQGKQFLLG